MNIDVKEAEILIRGNLTTIDKIRVNYSYILNYNKLSNFIKQTKTRTNYLFYLLTHSVSLLKL